MNHEQAILVVEDDADDVHFLTLAFERQGLHPSLVFVEDGEAAVRYLEGVLTLDERAIRRPPTRVLLDLKLPRRSGIDVLRWMRAHPRYAQTPVIVLTSSAQESDRAACEALGVDACLVKPIGLAELAASVAEIARLWNLQ